MSKSRIKIKQKGNVFYVDLPQERKGIKCRASFNEATYDLETTLTFSGALGAPRVLELIKMGNTRVAEGGGEKLEYGPGSPEFCYLEALERKRRVKLYESAAID